jgi:hypothetical protein
MEEFRSNPCGTKHQNLPDSLYRKLRLERSASTDRSLRRLLIFSAMLLKRGNLCLFLISRGWAKEHWRGVDPSKHVEREQASWD